MKAQLTPEQEKRFKEQVKRNPPGRTPQEIIRGIIDSQQPIEVLEEVTRQVTLMNSIKVFDKYRFPKLAEACRKRYEELYGECYPNQVVHKIGSKED